jgi:hypothetical protein
MEHELATNLTLGVLLSHQIQEHSTPSRTIVRAFKFTRSHWN